MQTFKQPLTKKEEEDFLRLFFGGNGEEREWAKQVLIERNLRLVAHIARKYQGTEADMEDLISIGTVGLIKALFSFNPEKQSKLGTYAARCIENAILPPMRLWLGSFNIHLLIYFLYPERYTTIMALSIKTLSKTFFSESGILYSSN